MMVPANYACRSAQAPLKGADGLALTIAECPPGDGPGLHCDELTIENFLLSLLKTWSTRIDW